MTPFDTGKNLGRAYNEMCSQVPEGDWICLLDHDVMFLTSDAINIMYGYVERYYDAGLLTCLTNRIHHSSQQLLLTPQGMDNTDIRYHMNVAERQKENLYDVYELHQNVSGFLMLFSRDTWKKHPFTEGIGCLGVDTAFWQELVENGKKILRMNGLYVFHIYRLSHGVNNKSHLL